MKNLLKKVIFLSLSFFFIQVHAENYTVENRAPFAVKLDIFGTWSQLGSFIIEPKGIINFDPGEKPYQTQLKASPVSPQRYNNLNVISDQNIVRTGKTAIELQCGAGKVSRYCMTAIVPIS